MKNIARVYSTRHSERQKFPSEKFGQRYKMNGSPSKYLNAK